MKLCRHLLVNWCRFRWLISEQRSFNWFVYVDLINVLSAFALFRFSLYRVRSSTRAPFPIFDRLNSNWQTHANNLFYSMSKIWFDFFSTIINLTKAFCPLFFRARWLQIIDNGLTKIHSVVRFVGVFVRCFCIFSFLSLALSIHNIQDMITIQAKVKLSILLCVLNQRNQDIRYSSHLLFWLSQSRSSSSSSCSINKHTITFDTRIPSSSS